jgi:ATP-dependent protease HslVU (ClpYQ) peptidase subunit
MTTLAYDHERKLIAIDSRVSAAGQIMCDKTIKFKVASDKSVWFYSGRPVDMNVAMNIFESYEQKCIKAPKDNIEFAAVIAFKGKAYFSYYTSSHDYVMEEAKHNDGFGSGGIYALCALNMGKTILNSIEFAKTMDTCSGGQVHVFDLKTMSMK